MQLEAGTSCDCARSPLAPTQTPADSCAPGPLHGTPALPCPGWPQSGVGEWSLRPCCPGNQTPHQEGEEEARKDGACGSLVAQEKAIEVNPTGLLWGALPHGPLPFQSPKVSKPASPRFSPGSPHSPELTLPPLGDGPGQATSSITRSSPRLSRIQKQIWGESL